MPITLNVLSIGYEVCGPGGGSRRERGDCSKLRRGTGEVRRCGEAGGTEDAKNSLSLPGVLATETGGPVEGKSLLMSWADTRASWKPCLRRMEEEDGLSLPKIGQSPCKTLFTQDGCSHSPNISAEAPAIQNPFSFQWMKARQSLRNMTKKCLLVKRNIFHKDLGRWQGSGNTSQDNSWKR